jgi:transcriptional regulator with XRE-family HTH domain
MQEIPSKKTLGERIKSLRIEKSYAQSYVAQLLNLSRSNYSQIELGNQYPTFSTLYTLSRYYNKSYNWLLHGTDDITFQEAKKNDLPVLINDLETSLQNFARTLRELENELQNIKKKIAVL